MCLTCEAHFFCCVGGMIMSKKKAMFTKIDAYLHRAYTLNWSMEPFALRENVQAAAQPPVQ